MSCVSDESSVSVIELPGAADAESCDRQVRNLVSGHAAFSVNGIGFVDSWNVSSSEIVPASPATLSKAA